MLALWTEAGTVSQGAGGILSLEWESITAWANHFYSENYVEWVEHPKQSKRHKSVYTPLLLTQCTLLDSELQLIRKLSQEYCAEYSNASDPSWPCPKTIDREEITEDAAMANADALGEALKRMFGKQDDTSIEVVQNK